MKYTGSCHCKSVTFEIEADPIEVGLQCNCSVCIRKNAIMSKSTYGPEQFTITSGQSLLSNYQWGDKDVNHYFCQRCGIYPFHDTSIEPGHYRVNLGCIQQLEPRELEIIQFNGRELL